ncbi:hypothetical protein [Kocuria sp. KH4]
MSPNFSLDSFQEPRSPNQYRVKTTGKVMDAVAMNSRVANPIEYRKVGGKLNVHVVTLADQETGELKTYLASAVEPLEVD